MGRAHEVCKRGEDRLTKEDMGSAGVSEDGRRGDRTQQGSMVTVVVVGIVRFQRGEGVRVRETRDWWRRDDSRDKRVGGIREGEVVLKDVKGLTRTVGGSGVGLSSVKVGLRGGVANRECGGGAGYYGWGLHSSRVR